MSGCYTCTNRSASPASPASPAPPVTPSVKKNSTPTVRPQPTVPPTIRLIRPSRQINENRSSFR
jgi:hypothetical protein